MRRASLIALVVLAAALPASAHPAPFSYLDLSLDGTAIEGRLVAHVIDVAHDLGVDPPETLLDPAEARRAARRIFDLLAPRLTLVTDGAPLLIEWVGIEALPDRQAVQLSFRFAPGAAGALTLTCDLFPYDPNHTTFLNIYEHGALQHQGVYDRGHRSYEYFRGTRQGRLALVGRFIQAGIHHIAIGPDHILFLIGLLLLGGSLLQLATIVTAFTLAHSVTLSLAALNIFAPPARVIEPAIALSIIYVGADNLLMTKEGRDLRAWIAFGFGLVHGFGFANVLRALDLPRRALGWSLFSFNVGVEIGQLVIVVVVSWLLVAIRTRSQTLARRVVVLGSMLVMAAGAYWFLERVFWGTSQ
jgi:hydrogenase/urease accessory protein HupE